jgi:hypothetical protein
LTIKTKLNNRKSKTKIKTIFRVQPKNLEDCSPLQPRSP